MTRTDLNKQDIIKVLQMPTGIRSTYLLWRHGIDPKYTMARDTYRRHRYILHRRWQIDITALPQ